MIKEVEANEAKNNWTLMKNSEVNNKHKNKDGKLKTILSIWYFKRKRLIEGRLTKQKLIMMEISLKKKQHPKTVNFQFLLNLFLLLLKKTRSMTKK